MMWRSLRQALKAAFCGLLTGHTRVLHIAGPHVCLKCVACQAETPGWELPQLVRKS